MDGNYFVIHKRVLPEVYEKVLNAKKLIKEGKVTNSLDYKVDNGFKRKISLFKSKLGHVYKYRKYLGGK